MCSPRLMRRLGLSGGGAVRVSLVHYNTEAEIDRFRDVLTGVVAALRSSRRHDAGVATPG